MAPDLRERPSSIAEPHRLGKLFALERRASVAAHPTISPALGVDTVFTSARVAIAKGSPVFASDPIESAEN
jgi:hypothetical protein